MKELSESGKTLHTGAEFGPSGTEAPPGDPDDGGYGQFLKELDSLDLDKLSPMEALNLLYSWKQLFASKPYTNRPLPAAPCPPVSQEPGKAPPRNQGGNLRGGARLGPHDSQDEPSLFD
jgi:hypothetical protein